MWPVFGEDGLRQVGVTCLAVVPDHEAQQARVLTDGHLAHVETHDCLRRTEVLVSLLDTSLTHKGFAHLTQDQRSVVGGGTFESIGSQQPIHCDLYFTCRGQIAENGYTQGGQQRAPFGNRERVLASLPID